MQAGHVWLGSTCTGAVLDCHTRSNRNSESVSIPKNPRTDRPVGYAFVDLSTPTEAERAIAELSGQEVLERKVSVQLARKPEHNEKSEGANGESNQRQQSTRGRGGRGNRARGGRGRGGRTVRTVVPQTLRKLANTAAGRRQRRGRRNRRCPGIWRGPKAFGRHQQRNGC